MMAKMTAKRRTTRRGGRGGGRGRTGQLKSNNLHLTSGELVGLRSAADAASTSVSEGEDVADCGLACCRWKDWCLLSGPGGDADG